MCQCFQAIEGSERVGLSYEFWSAALVMREPLLKEMMGGWDLLFGMKSTARMESFSLH